MVAEVGALSRYWEKIALFALLMSLTAISIDIILPAYPALAQEFSLTSVTHLQNNILVFIAGMFFGEIIAGFYADIHGRRKILLTSVAVYLLGTSLCFFADDFTALLLGRGLQGVGAGGQKICTRTLIRDHFAGAAMARVMSLVMITFIFLPFLAPAVGAAILQAWDWRAIFMFLAVFVSMTLAWFWWRQPETLMFTQKNQQGIVSALRLLRTYISHPRSCGYTFAAGVLFGVHLAFLSLSPLILQDLYRVEKDFPFYFGVIAGGFGLALFINVQAVMHLGMQRVVNAALVILLLVSSFMTALTGFINAEPTRMAFLTYLAITLFCLGLIFGNLNALIMEPLGAAAGLGNAFASACSTLVALPISYWIGSVYHKSAFSVSAPIFVCVCLAVMSCIWAQRGPRREFRYE